MEQPGLRHHAALFRSSVIDEQPGQERPRPGEGQDVSFMQSMQQRAAQAEQQQQAQPAAQAQQQQPQAQQQQPQAQQQQPQAQQQQPQAQRGGAQRRGGRRAPAAAQQMGQPPGAVAAGEPLDMGAVQKALPPVPKAAVVPKRTAFPQRPEHGRLGRPIQLVANHFEIELPHGDVYHYDVSIVSSSKKAEAKAPDQKKMRCLSTRINRLVVQNLVAKYRGELNRCLPAFDGRKNLYTRKPLPFKERTFNVPFQEGDREEEFIVTVQYAATVNLDALHAVYNRTVRTVPQEVIQALDIIMRHGPCITLTPVGRSIFMPPGPNDNSELGGGHEVWFGYYTSVRPAQWKPMLNIDRSATAFYEAIPVIEFMCKLLSEGPPGAHCQKPEAFRRLTASQCIKLSKELKDLKVRVLHLSYPRKYKVAKVTQLPAQELCFNLDEGTKTNVAEYFRQKYPKYMRFPNLPCIQAGTPNRPVYLPLEACHIVEGQPYRKKLSESMTTEMIRRTAQPPVQRFRSIMSSVQDVVNKSRPYLDEFGIKVSTNPTQLKGRVLEPPSLTFHGQQTLRPRDGVWDLRSSRLLTAKPIDKWALLGVNCRLEQGAINNMVRLFKDIGGNLGMAVNDPLVTRSEQTGRRPILQILKELKDSNVELVIVVLGRQASYADIKEAAEVKLGIRTQCIKELNMTRKCNPALITNLCLKINAKLGGTNNGLLSQEKPAIFKDPLIIIGADVTHPAPGDRVKPSIAACVGSMDPIPSRYQASIRVQIQKEEAVARVEIIEDLKEMIKELLKAFYQETRHKPVRIIFYRDGVSEGQFGIVRDQELSAIRQACLELSPDGSYKPPVTFIVVQKRHHTRFMPANERDGVGRARNIPPGTTVDTVVTHPVDFDFFLCSHAGIQGTSKPAHYYVVHDDANFTSDDLQKLSYYLCHTYARCARSVSIPAPVYYAHLAAFRAKEHIASACNVPSGSSVSSGGSDQVSTEQYVSAVKVTQAMQKHMYFV
ncbi:protein argonaute-2-like isoform X2 [Dermacentor variabilis]|uniref:protein argonaute-2-like isoform X2 n=1 Tax=Dermacentor variabilis TaxID=34621 RepID=UPI003F5CB92A